MKRLPFPHAYLPAVVLLLLTLLVIVLSWLLNVYDVEVARSDGTMLRVRSLISGEGVRWMLTHATSGFASFPPTGIGVMVLMALGLAVDSGLVGGLRSWVLRLTNPSAHGPLPRKETRGLRAAFVVLLLMIVIVLLLTFTPWAILRGADGSLLRSPLMWGMGSLLSLTLSLMSAMYGWVVERYRSLEGIVGGLSHLSPWMAWYLITLFFASALWGCLSHSNLISG